jgi:hypothetical protein
VMAYARAGVEANAPTRPRQAYNGSDVFSRHERIAAESGFWGSRSPRVSARPAGEGGSFRWRLGPINHWTAPVSPLRSWRSTASVPAAALLGRHRTARPRSLPAARAEHGPVGSRAVPVGGADSRSGHYVGGSRWTRRVVAGLLPPICVLNAEYNPGTQPRNTTPATEAPYR